MYIYIKLFWFLGQKRVAQASLQPTVAQTSLELSIFLLTSRMQGYAYKTYNHRRPKGFGQVPKGTLDLPQPFDFQQENIVI